MIRSFENLTTGLTRMRHKAALMLMSNVAEQGALKIEYASAHGTLEFGALWGLAHCVDWICVSQPFQPVSRRSVSGGWGARGTTLIPKLLIVRCCHRPTHQTSVWNKRGSHNQQCTKLEVQKRRGRSFSSGKSPFTALICENPLSFALRKWLLPSERIDGLPERLLANPWTVTRWLAAASFTKERKLASNLEPHPRRCSCHKVKSKC